MTATVAPASSSGSGSGVRRMRRLVRGAGRFVADITVPGRAARGHPAKPVRPRGDHAARRLPGARRPRRRGGVLGRRPGRPCRCLHRGRAQRDHAGPPGAGRPGGQVLPVARARPWTRRSGSDSRSRWSSRATATPPRTASRPIEVDYEPLARRSPTPRRRWPMAPRSPPGARRQRRRPSAHQPPATSTRPSRGAPHVLRERFTFGRHAANAMETRSVQASYDAGRGELTVWITNPRPHLIRHQPLPDARLAARERCA